MGAAGSAHRRGRNAAAVAAARPPRARGRREVHRARPAPILCVSAGLGVSVLAPGRRAVARAGRRRRVTTYAAWLSHRLTGRVNVLSLTRRVTLPLVLAYCGY